MKVISVFDTTVSEYNLGNQIIMDSVQRELNDIFGNRFQYNVPYQQINRRVGRCIKQSDYTFFGGTNSLSSFMNRYKQWDMNLIKTLYIKDVIMMGIGWWQYQDDPNLYTRYILNKSLSKKYYHSARDSYTTEKLRKLGFKVINTGCPTLWGIKPELINEINGKEKSKDVVFTLTDYNKDIERDKELFDICINNYEKVYIWPQGVGDFNYINQIDSKKEAIIIDSNLKAYDEILEQKNVDYIGTRLHAGVRALQKGIRAFFVAIDNRTIEMGNDVGLPYIERKDVLKIEKLLNQKYIANLNINYEAINKWKSQFR